MAIKRILQAAGIMTDPSALSADEASSGAMRDAVDVILHRAGSLQPRPGFGDREGVASRATAYRPTAIWPWLEAGTTVVQSTDGTDWRLERLESGSVWAGPSAGAAPPEPRYRGRSAVFEQRGSLWYTSARGIRKLTGSGAPEDAGIWQTYQPVGHSLIDPGAPSELVAIDSTAGDRTVAYRWLVRRTDSRGYEMRGPPSSRSLITVTTSAYPNGAWNELFGPSALRLPADAREGDVIEIYRTPGAAGEPGEDYYLAVSYPLTDTDIAAGQALAGGIPDQTPDTQLGVALYTSSSQLGALASKERPPKANHIAWWKGVGWAANGRERRTLLLSITKAGVGDKGLTHWSRTGTFTIGSPTVTDVWFDTTPPPRVGQWIGGSLSGPVFSSAAIPAFTTIAAIVETAPSTYTITMSASATASGSHTVRGGDVIEVGGVSYYVASSALPAGRSISISGTTLAERVARAALDLSAALAYSVSLGLSTVVGLYDPILGGGDGTVLLRETGFGGGAFVVRCRTRPEAFATPGLEAGLSAGESLHRNRLWWSAPDQPAAWPPAQFTSIGPEQHPIEALVPLDDALLVWTTAGLWRVAGSPPNGWAVDPLSSSHRLLSPEAWCVLGGVCYAWTDRGVVAVREGGIGPVVSAPIADQLREIQQRYPLGGEAHRRGVWLEAHPRLGLVICHHALDPSDDAATGGQWVFHTSTGAWTRWTRTEDRCSAYDPREDRLVVGLDEDRWRCVYERDAEDDPASYRDREEGPLTPASWVSESVVRVTAADVPWQPTTCDVLEAPDAGTYHRIVSVEADGATWRLTLDPPVSGSLLASYFLVDEHGDYIVDEHGDRIAIALAVPADVVLHEAIHSSCVWQAQHLPGVTARWQESHAQLLDGSAWAIDRWTLRLGARSDLGSGTVPISVTSAVALSRPLRTGYPRGVVRARAIYPEVSVCRAGVLWRLAEIHLHATAGGRRVAR